MKISKLLSLAIIPAAILPINIVSCCSGGSSDPETPEEEEEKVKEIKITHSGNFSHTFTDCSAGSTYSTSFTFTSSSKIDLTKYELKLNSSEWSLPSASYNYSWSQENLSLSLKLDITLTSSFSTSTTVSSDSLKVYLIKKSSQETINTYSFGSLEIILNAPVTPGTEYTVTFVTNGGSDVSSQKVKAGSTATKPSTTKTGYSLVNWYKNGSVFDFSTKITSNITLYAYWTESDPYDYIHNRSFSLGCWGESIEQPGYYSLGWGTSWIISDATPSDTTDYTYWIATNWHVVDGQDQVQAAVKNFTVGYADDKSASGIEPVDGYTVFNSYVFEGYDKFYFNKSQNKAIDFVVAKANFASAPTSIKTKLNKLNYQQKTQGYINRFVNTTSSTHYENNKTYLAGFPVQNDYYATWEYHSLPTNDLYFVEENPHEVNEAETINDYSYQYETNTNYGSSWMKGGASGSMLITKLNNEWSPIGIYWGGWGQTGTTNFWPSFSIFKSDKKDFIASYI